MASGQRRMWSEMRLCAPSVRSSMHSQMERPLAFAVLRVCAGRHSCNHNVAWLAGERALMRSTSAQA